MSTARYEALLSQVDSAIERAVANGEAALERDLLRLKLSLLHDMHHLPTLH